MKARRSADRTTRWNWADRYRSFNSLDSRCCGMAGSFGYEEGHYDVSKACEERVLFPAVRGTPAEDLVVAPGFSCRHQIADFCEGRRSVSTPELLAMTE